MANTDVIFTLPEDITTLTATSAASAWGYGSYVLITDRLSRDILVKGVAFQPNTTLTADVTEDVIMDIARGETGNETTIIQIPYSHREDTSAAHYMTHAYGIFLPEPMFIPAGTRLSCRFADTSTNARTYSAIKLSCQTSGRLWQRNEVTNNFQFVGGGSGLSFSERIR